MRCADLDNLVAACRRAVALGDGDAAAGALEGAWAALKLRGPFGAGVELAESVCAVPGLNDRAAAHARSVLANSLVACGRRGRRARAVREALAFARAAGDRRCEAMVMCSVGSLQKHEGRTDEARAQTSRRLAWRANSATATGMRGDQRPGQCGAARGPRGRSLTHYEHALALAREAGDRNMQGSCSATSANCICELGRIDEARPCDARHW